MWEDDIYWKYLYDSSERSYQEILSRKVLGWYLLNCSHGIYFKIVIFSVFDISWTLCTYIYKKTTFFENKKSKICKDLAKIYLYKKFQINIFNSVVVTTTIINELSFFFQRFCCIRGHISLHATHISPFRNKAKNHLILALNATNLYHET